MSGTVESQTLDCAKNIYNFVKYKSLHKTLFPFNEGARNQDLLLNENKDIY